MLTSGPFHVCMCPPTHVCTHTYTTYTHHTCIHTRTDTCTHTYHTCMHTRDTHKFFWGGTNIQTTATCLTEWLRDKIVIKMQEMNNSESHFNFHLFPFFPPFYFLGFMTKPRATDTSINSSIFFIFTFPESNRPCRWHQSGA